jgi:hypothetical protein
MSVLQPALHSSSVTPALSRTAAQCSAVCPFCKDEGVVASERCSHAALLSVPSIKHTDGRRGKEPRHKVYSAQDNNTNIMHSYYLFVLKAAHACNANRRKHTLVCPHTHTQPHTHTHTLSLRHTCAQEHTSTKIHHKICTLAI